MSVTPTKDIPETKPAHSTAPWEAFYSQDAGHWYIDSDDGSCQFMLRATSDLMSLDEMGANAKLIAAAPDLLAMVKELRHMEYLDENGDACTFAEFWPAGAARVVAMIEKAEGR